MPSKRHKKADVIDDAFIKARNLAHQIKNGQRVRELDILCNPRSHLVLAEEEDKIRMVYGYHFWWLIHECVLYWSLCDAITASPNPTMWGREILNAGMKDIRTNFPTGRLYVCIDWKKFDKSLQHSLIREAFKILRSYMNFNHYRATGDQPMNKIPEPGRLQNLWFKVIDNFLHGTVRTSDGRRWRRAATGVPSGSLFTEMINSICNAVIVNAVCDITFGTLPDIYRVFGDDSGLAVNSDMRPDVALLRMKRNASELLGVDMNVKKSIASNNKNDIVMLGYKNFGGYPTMDIDELLARLLLPENNPYKNEFFKARAIGLAWASVGQDKRFLDMSRDIVRRYDDTEPNFSILEWTIKITLGRRDIVSVGCCPTQLELLTMLQFRSPSTLGKRTRS